MDHHTVSANAGTKKEKGNTKNTAKQGVFFGCGRPRLTQKSHAANYGFPPEYSIS